MNKYFKKPGFTLIELLVAATILVMVMTIVVATLSSLMKVQRRILANRQANQSLRQTLETISRAVWEGTAKGKIDNREVRGVTTFRFCQTGNFTSQPDIADGLISFAPRADGTFLVRVIKMSSDGRKIEEAQINDADGEVTSGQLADSSLYYPLFDSSIQLTKTNYYLPIGQCPDMGFSVFYSMSANTIVGVHGELQKKDMPETNLKFDTAVTTRYK